MRGGFKAWRASPTGILPCGFLQSLALGLTELPTIYLFRDIRCDAYRKNAPSDSDPCRSSEVQRAYASDVAVYLFIVTVLSIGISGPYGKLSDMRGRKIAMGIAAAFNAVGDTWMCLCCKHSWLAA
jgi:MFS family permease